MDISEIRDLYPFKSRFHALKEHRYHYIDEGNGEPVVMLHGNPTWSFMYRDLILEFRKTHRVVAPDHLGCGLSDKPGDFPYRLETHIDNLENLLLSLKLKNINLLVHDWGAPIGLGFAVRHPKLIKSLVILNSSAFSSNQLPWRIAVCKLPVVGEFLIRRCNLFSLAATRMTVENPLSDEVRRGYLLPYDSYENRVAINRFVRDIPIGPEAPSYEALLEIEHGLWLLRENPVCLVWGMKDWCFTPAFLERWLVYYPQAVTLRLRNAGHYVQEDCGEELIAFVRHFLSHPEKRNRQPKRKG